MSNELSRRNFLRKGSTIAASGLAIPVAGTSSERSSKEMEGEKGAGKLSQRRRFKATLLEPAGNVAADELRRFAPDSREDLPKSQEWWRTNFLRVDFDMGMTDAAPEAFSKLNPVDTVVTIADAGLQLLWGYIQDGSGWLFYPSKIGHQHPRLNGRDLVSEYIAACRRYGLKFGGYYVPDAVGVEAARHPEWRVEFPGSAVPSSPLLAGGLCFNRPGAWEFYRGIIEESLTNYEMDAVWVDSWYYQHCGCVYCQKRYREETGRELPFYLTPNDPERPEFGAYYLQVQKWMDCWAVELNRTIKKARPDCVIELHYVHHDRVYPEEIVQRVDAGDFSSSDTGGLAFQYQHSLEIKCVRTFSRIMPFDIMIPISEHHADELSPKQEGLLKQQFAYTLAHGGGVTYIDDMYWEGRISKSKYERMKRVNAWARERFPYLGGVLAADVGLYFSPESHVYHPKWKHWRWSSPRGDAERGTGRSIHNAGNVAFGQAMLREHIPFDFLRRNHPQDLARYQVVYMNNVEVLSEKEAIGLREFVNAGGGLVITHRTGMRDENLQARENFLLADLMGVDYVEKPDLATSFIMVGEQDRAEGFFPRVHPETPYFEVHDAQCYVRPRETTRCLGKAARPRRPHNETDFTGVGVVPGPIKQLIDPKEVRQPNIGYLYYPEIITEHPALVLNRYGKGRVAYCAAYLSYDYIDNIHDLILGLVRWAAGGKLDAMVTSNAPAPVEIVTMEQLKKNRTVVHAINWQPNWPAVEAHHVEVAIKSFGRRAKRAFAVEAKRDLSVLPKGERVHLTFPPIEAWETVILEWK